MQEGDVQIKGFPIRLPLDILLVFSANPEDYTARGKIITPLKDRIGSEIKTHYPHRLDEGIRITLQESWTDREPNKELLIPEFVREIVEGIAFHGRRDSRIDKRSGISQRVPISCLENTVSNAERRATLAREKRVVLRVADVYASIPAITGKLELEYEGQLRGEENVARELIEASVLNAFVKRFPKGILTGLCSGSIWAGKSRLLIKRRLGNISGKPNPSRDWRKRCVSWTFPLKRTLRWQFLLLN